MDSENQLNEKQHYLVLKVKDRMLKRESTVSSAL